MLRFALGFMTSYNLLFVSDSLCMWKDSKTSSGDEYSLFMSVRCELVMFVDEVAQESTMFAPEPKEI